MASSPVTPTPPSMTSRMARPPDRSFDIRSVVKQQDVAKDLPLPALTPTQIATCEHALKELKQKVKGNGGRNVIDREFDALQAERMQNYRAFSQTTAAVSPINRTKNRYINVLPYDNTRVVLDKKHGGPNSSDYINASFVQDPVHEDLPRYIATQGPLPDTAGDLWTMVLQQRCPIIVMLTRIADGDQDKCALYFPRNENESQTYGRIVVTNNLLSSSQHGFARRVLEVKDSKSLDTPLTVLHYEYLEWPDYYVPFSTRSVRELIRALFNIPPQVGPFVVHCSAGIGRTGTYCTIDHTLRRVLCGDSGAVDIENTVRQFRLQRDGMVQTREQYRFVYDAVIQELEDYVCTGVRPESTVQP
ncbi:hypothetical protein M758_4G007400 [Ceratodon purpureus]|uniref:protein-tyrosine-phosphatase n=1 Tax=Ceratodon purpureus TaxID=3225 RepID=A0A8T0I554_CERPU|nr:hypothetical protein KC19_4G008000 [Ceratodon purpureus]KAG0617678.1 hypothetical protein M758_4G007400 [Ceratodon purpureus]